MSSYARTAPPPPEGSIPFPQSSPRSRARDSTEATTVQGTPSKYRRGEGSIRRESQSSPSHGLPGIKSIFKLDRDADENGGHDAMELEAAQALMTAKDRAATRSDASSDDMHSRHASAIAMLSMASSQSNPDFLRRPPYGHASMGSDPAGAYRRPQLKVDPGAAQRMGTPASGDAALPSPFARRRHTLGASDEPVLSPGAAAAAASAAAAAEQRTPSRTPRSGKRSFNSQLDSPTTPTIGESNRRYASDATPVHSHIYLRGPDAPTGSLPSLALAELTASRGHARNMSFESQGGAPSMSRPRPPPFGGSYGSSRSDLASPRTSAGALSFSSSGWHSRSSTLESVETPVSSPAYTKLPHDLVHAKGGYGPSHSQEGTSPPSAQASEDQLRHRFESMRAFPAPPRWDGEAVGGEDGAGAPGPRPRARTMSAAGRPMARLPGTAASQQQAARSHFVPTHSRHESYELDAGAGPSSRASVMDVDEEVDEEGEDDTTLPGGSESWRRQGRPRIDSGDSTGSMARPGSSANRPISPQGSSVYRPMSRDSVASAGGTIVSGMAKYECSWCGKRFSRPSSLKIHHHSHTGDKPFVCHEPGCGRAFSVQSNLRRHQKCHGPGSGGGSAGSSGGAAGQQQQQQPQTAPAGSSEHFRPPQPPGEGPDRTRYSLDGAPGSAPALMSPSRHGSLRGMRTGPPPSAGAPGPMAAPSSAGPGIPVGPGGGVGGFHAHTSTSGYPMPFAPMHMHGHPPLSRSAYEPGSRSFALPWPSIPGAHAGGGGPRFAAGPGLGLADSHAHGMHPGHPLYQQQSSASFRGPPGAHASSAPAHTQAFGGGAMMSAVRPPAASFARARDRRQSASSSVGGDDDEGARVRSALASGPLSSSRFSTAGSVAENSSDGDDDIESPPLDGGPQLGRSASLNERQRRDTATSTMRKGFEGLLNPQS